ncbi:MAG: phosphoribosylanthranilate isomerase [Solirubrobacterales bacterium]|nr:phosphoribosylanthranilate isomerase [Solirubrobacterales bacterium]
MARVKICGVTRLADGEAAVEHGAWAIGLNHSPASKRFVMPDVAAEIGAALKRQCEVVGVFVNATLDEVTFAADNASLSMLQLHGEEGPEFCEEAARRTGCKVIKAIRVRDSGDVQAAEVFRTDYHLFDAHRPGEPGGTGERFDWGLVARRRSSVPMILAGGLRPDNVAEAMATVRAYAIDVASGVESEPGIKDPVLLEELFAALKVPA